MFDRILRFVRKTSAVIPVIVRSWFGGEHVPPPVNTADYLSLYRIDPWVYACVWIIANTAARIPIRIRKPDGSFITDHRLLDLVNRPNPGMMRSEFFEATFSYLELAGNAFWEKVRNRLVTPQELYVLRPDRMNIVPGVRGVSGYSYIVGSESIDFRPDNIVHIRYFDPLDDWRGMPSVRSLNDSVVIDRHASNWIIRSLQRFGTKEGHLKTDQPIGEPEVARLGRKWQGRFNEEGRTPLLPKGLEYKEYGDGIKAGGVFDADNLTRQRKAAVTGVPPVKIGLLEHAKYQSYDFQSRAFIYDTMIPKLERVANAITLHLLPDFPSLQGCTFEFDTTQIAFTDVLTFVNAVTKLFDRNALTINEVIRLTGLGKPYDGGDIRYLDVRKEILRESTRSPKFE